MSSKFSSSIVALLAIVFASTSCREAISPESIGIRVSVTVTGIDMPETIQIILGNGATIDVKANSSQMISVASGLNTLRIAALPPNCIADNDVLNDVLVPDRGTAFASFSVSCVSVVNRIQDQDIVFSRDNDLYVIRSDGTGLVKVTDAPQGTFYRDPEWSPDGRRIVFSVFRDRMIWISVMNADGPNVERPLVSDAFDPTWSPTGSQIAFMGNAAIKIVSADGPRVSGVDGSPVNSYGQFPTWSRQDIIAFVKGQYDLSDNLIKSDVFTMTKTGENVRQITSGGTTTLNDYPAWSPDGTQVAFVRSDLLPCQPATCGLAVMNADGTNLRIIANDARAWFLSWSPDGRQIAFASQFGIEIVNSDGTERRFLLSHGSYPSWRQVPPK